MFEHLLSCCKQLVVFLVCHIGMRIVVQWDDAVREGTLLFCIERQGHWTFLQSFLDRLTTLYAIFKLHCNVICTFFFFLIFRGPCIVMYSYNKGQRDALFLSYIFTKNSYTFWTDFLSIISSLITVFAAIGILSY